MSSHTQGKLIYRPWAQDDETIAQMKTVGMKPSPRMGNMGERYISRESGEGIAHVLPLHTPRRGKGYLLEDAERDANARRLVACWNAMEGIPTEDIEKGFATLTVKGSKK